MQKVMNEFKHRHYKTYQNKGNTILRFWVFTYKRPKNGDDEER